MPRVTIRLSESEAKALEQLPGKGTSARVRYLLHQSSLVGAIRSEIERVFASKIPSALPQSDAAREALSATEFRVALSIVVGLIGTVLPAEKRALAAMAGERILNGVQATAEDAKSAIQAASSQPEPIGPAVKTEYPPRPATGAGVAGEAPGIMEIFGSVGGKQS